MREVLDATPTGRLDHIRREQQGTASALAHALLKGTTNISSSWISKDELRARVLEPSWQESAKRPAYEFHHIFVNLLRVLGEGSVLHDYIIL
jgi:hypothetical protein